jgi:lipopolysaccharide transport system permease protein
MAKSEASVEFVIESETANLVDIKELWRYRELLYFFSWRDVKIKYKQAALGVLWALLQPVFMVLIFTFLFSNALKVPASELPYTVYAFSGLLLWNLFSSGINNANNSMVASAQIIKKVYFPRLIIPFASVMSAAFDFIVAFALYIVVLIYFGVEVNWLQLLYLWPCSIILAIIGTLGPSFLLSALTVKYRDFKYVVPFALQVLFFLTPVIYSPTVFRHDWIQHIVSLNPIFAAIQLWRLPIEPLQVFKPELISTSIGSAIVFFFVGLLYFRKTERYFADLA